MIEFHFTHDIFNKDPIKRKKKTGIEIVSGYTCISSSDCDCSWKCPYRIKKEIQLFSKIRFFFWNKFNIKIPKFFHFYKRHIDLSGTTKCPHYKSRNYTCFDCKYCDFTDGDSLCTNRNYIDNPYEKNHDFIDLAWRHPRRCKWFEKNEYADTIIRDVEKDI